MIRSTALLLLSFMPAVAESRRIVVLKMDGVPAGLLEEALREKDPQTGKSRLPWIDEIFVKHGARVANFYVRGVSLSAPSWALLDTGQHQRIHGNVEYDRLTLRSYDYLNFFPFYLNSARGRRADAPGVEVLDDSGVPLLIDRFPWSERYQSFQLYQRWVRWKTLQQSLQNRFKLRSPRELFDEWQTGFELSSAIGAQTERELLEHLASDQYLYLDFFSGDFDHVAHLTNNRASQMEELQYLDKLAGRVWDAIENSVMAPRTTLAIVSDHGMTTTPQAFSQGYSLLDWFRSSTGGAHHTATDRYPLDQYKVRGLYPLVSEVISPSRDSLYLKGESQQYPTAFLDLDGNERAAVQLRNSTLNALQILLQQMARKELSSAMRRAAFESFFDLLEEKREEWSRDLRDMKEELAALRETVRQERQTREPKRKYSDDELEQGENQEERRQSARLQNWEQDERSYSDYLKVLSNLLSLERSKTEPRNLRVEDLIPKRSLGPANTLFDLQNYVAGPSREGMVPARQGASLDVVESFQRVDYFPALLQIAVRNNVQKGVGPRPVDFIATRIPEGVWLFVDPTHQVIVMSRELLPGQLELRYVPVANLRGSSDGKASWSQSAWIPKLPLKLWEDTHLDLPAGANREEWLAGWHTDREWLRATYRTAYSNGVVAIHEQFLEPEPLGAMSPVLKRYQARRRSLVMPDFLIFASNHWNFNVRGFNPGGNHGGFSQPSMHSLLMFAGGGVPQGLTIAEPYDSLSFAPTLLRLAGKEWEGLPGPVVRELFK